MLKFCFNASRLLVTPLRLLYGKYRFIQQNTPVRPVKILLAAALYQNLEENNQEENIFEAACENGENAVLNLMDALKEQIIRTSNQYRLCINKQIEIIRIATNLGHLSEKWDELPEFRTQAEAIREELNRYYHVFNVLGQMAYDQSVISNLSGRLDFMEALLEKYKDLEVAVTSEIEKNKDTEKLLLHANKDSILKPNINKRNEFAERKSSEETPSEASEQDSF